MQMDWRAPLAFVLGFAATALPAWRPPAFFSRPRHLRQNYRGRAVVGTLGAVLAMALRVGAVAGGTSRTTVLAGGAAVFGLLGLIDDLYGSSSARGFAGHIGALLRGRPTTGSLKAAGGAAAGLAAAWGMGERGWRVPAGGALIALAANLANLLDLRPGRAAKAWLATWAVSIWFEPVDVAAVTAALAGGVVAFLRPDLRERGMLGDTGANLLGAAIGGASVTALGDRSLIVGLAVLAVLTAASELVSFSRVIEAVPPLRAADRLGRLRD